MSELIAVTPTRTMSVPDAISELGPAAEFAYEEFFAAQVRNRHTRAAYRRAVGRFLAWLGTTGRSLPQVTPGMVGGYFDSLTHSVSTKKLELAALRAFFDTLVTRHVVVLNPAAAVRGERYSVSEGRTPEVTPEEARRLLASVSTAKLSGLRDRAVIACLIYTAARAGAVARLQLRDLQHDAGQYVLRFAEKGGRQREIPVRHDLQGYLFDYLSAAGFEPGRSVAPLFQSVRGRSEQLTGRSLTGVDICRIVKRWAKVAGLSARLSPHSFRVCAVTDLLTQGVPLEDVQYLVGHADPRTTRLYDRRGRKVTRNIVERISV